MTPSIYPIDQLELPMYILFTSASLFDHPSRRHCGFRIDSRFRDLFLHKLDTLEILLVNTINGKGWVYFDSLDFQLESSVIITDNHRMTVHLDS